MNSPPDLSAAGVADAYRLTVTARNALFAAQSRLDDAGFECEELAHLYADTAALVSEWSGRDRPPETKAIPEYIVRSAVEWRRQNRRSY